MRTIRIALGAALLLSSIGAASIELGHARRPVIVSAQEWGSKPQPIPGSRKQTPQFITIHHAGEIWTGEREPADYVRDMQAWGQRDQHWPDLPYHFLIAPDGRIFAGRPLAYEPDSNTKYPLHGSVGVELLGNFEAQRTSLAQLRSCVLLVAWLSQDLHIDTRNIRGHKDAAPDQTDCPGRDFYRYLQGGEFMAWVKEARAGRTPDITLGPPLTGGPTAMIPTVDP